MLARHGETEWSRSGRHTGRTDIPLTDEGRRQAEALRPALAELEPALVLTSPLSRAAETCRLAGLGDVAVEEPALMEWDYGDYEGLTSDQIHQERPGWNVFEDGAVGGETPDQVAARVDGVIDRMVAAERAVRGLRPRPRAARAGRALDRAAAGGGRPAGPVHRHAERARHRARRAAPWRAGTPRPEKSGRRRARTRAAADTARSRIMASAWYPRPEPAGTGARSRTSGAALVIRSHQARRGAGARARGAPASPRSRGRPGPGHAARPPGPGPAGGPRRPPCTRAPSASSGNDPASQAAHTTPPAAGENAPSPSPSPHDAHEPSSGAKPAASSSLMRKASIRAARRPRDRRAAAPACCTAGCRRPGWDRWSRTA